MDYKKLNNITGWAVFIIATIVYLMTLESTTSLWDCGEYITTANKLEVGHPPGAPFFMMMGRLFSAFASAENAAWMVNAMSGLSSSFTILFFFWSMTMLAKKIATRNGETLDQGKIFAILGTGAVGALAYTFTDSFWFSAVEGEVYAMSSFFTAIVFWAILKWEEEITVSEGVTASKRRFLAHPDRWLIFIAYMVGLSIGVHLLNLLAIPAIAFVIYFKKHEFNIKSFLIAGVIAVGTLGIVQAIIIPKIPSIADWFERLFTNSMGMPFNSGSIIFFLLITGLIAYGIHYTSKNGKEILNTVIVSTAVLLIGYSSFTMIVVRSNANTPLDENNPETLSSLVSYLNRDQYGSWPILNGQNWNSPQYSDCSDEHLDAPKEAHMKVYAITPTAVNANVTKELSDQLDEKLSGLGLAINTVENPNEKGSYIYSIADKEVTFMNMFELDEYRSTVDSINNELDGIASPIKIGLSADVTPKYINTFEHRPKGDAKYITDFQFTNNEGRPVTVSYKTLFPRMYRLGEGANYMYWSGYEGNQDVPLPPEDIGGELSEFLTRYNQGKSADTKLKQYQLLSSLSMDPNVPPENQEVFADVANQLYSTGLYKPSAADHFRYFRDYQLGWMYFRYFLWNFAGRQNDTQGYGGTGGGSKLLEGNWLSGVDFIDEQRLGSQENLPTIQRLNKGYNKYYLLPLILGLIGFIFHVVKSPKDWFVIMLLFLLTGIAIVIYLNQKPAEPRERDYAYAASFYAFAFWIGMGVYALFDAARNMKWKDLGIIGAYSIGAGVVIYIAETIAQGHHAFSYSIFYMSFIALALHALMIGVGNAVKNGASTAMLATGLGIVIPVILAVQNWDDHNRNGRYVGRDFAYNYLMSCDENAILFTNGDNDTFPLWYIQEVEGVRTDIRVANMSLLSTDWHINQMKRRAYDSDPLPITINEFDYRNGKRDFVLIDESESPEKNGKFFTAREAINFIMNDKNMKTSFFWSPAANRYRKTFCNMESFIDFKGIYIPVDKEAAVEHGIVTPEQAELMEDTIRWNLKGSALYKADLAVLDILANYKWDRPIYFASIGGMGANSHLAKYMQAEGMAYKLTPINFGGGGGTNTDKMYELIMGKYAFEKDGKITENVGFKWGNMNQEGVLVEYYALRMVQNIRLQIMKLTDALIREGKQDKAIEVLDKAFEMMPIENNQVAPDDICFYLCGNYYEAGAKEKGDKLGKQLVTLELEKFEYYMTLEPKFFDMVWKEWGKALNNIEMLREASLKDEMTLEKMMTPDPTGTFFANQGVLEGTSYTQACTTAAGIFGANYQMRPNFFDDAQSFPKYYGEFLWKPMFGIETEQQKQMKLQQQQMQMQQQMMQQQQMQQQGAVPPTGAPAP